MKKQPTKQKKPKNIEISSFYISVPKIMINVTFLRYVARQTDERTEKVTYRGGCLPEKVGKQHSFNYIPLFASNMSCISSAALTQEQQFYKVISHNS